MRYLPPLNAIKGFEAVVRLGNHKSAAAELGVTHGAISRQVKVLEDYFGCKLFQAKGRTLEPTELARYFAAETGVALDRLSQATQRVREPAMARQVRVTGTSSLLMHWLLPRLPEFQAAHPTIEVSIAANRSTYERLVPGHDVILRRHVMQRDGYSCRALFRDSRVLVASPRLLERVRIAAPEDVLCQTLLVHDGRTEAGVWERWMAGSGLQAQRRTNRIKFDHVFVMIEAAMNGLGLALVSKELMQRHLDSGALVELFPELRMAYPKLYALYPEESTCTPSVRRFMRWIVGEGEKISGPFDEVEPAMDLPAPDRMPSLADLT